MPLRITHTSLDGVYVVHLTGAIFFDADSISLRVHVKDLPIPHSRPLLLGLATS
jgi:hypothetical protein